MATIKGVIGRKLGMTQIWNDDNNVVPVTVVEAGPCRVVQIKTNERDGYSALQLSFDPQKPSRLNKAELGHLAKAGIEPANATSHLAEIRLPNTDGIEIGQVIRVNQFAPGEIVDVTGYSKGKGFAGSMKRHNFSGQGASHGNHAKHRTPGSIGACAAPGRVFKGKKMAGQMGAKKVTTQNLEIVNVDLGADTLLIKGAIPGPKGSIVFIKNAAKRPESVGFNFEEPEPEAVEDVVEEVVEDVVGEEVADAVDDNAEKSATADDADRAADNPTDSADEDSKDKDAKDKDAEDKTEGGE